MEVNMSDQKICPIMSRILVTPINDSATEKFQPILCQKSKCELWFDISKAEGTYVGQREGCSLRIGTIK